MTAGPETRCGIFGRRCPAHRLVEQFTFKRIADAVELEPTQGLAAERAAEAFTFEMIGGAATVESLGLGSLPDRAVDLSELASRQIDVGADQLTAVREDCGRRVGLGGPDRRG